MLDRVDKFHRILILLCLLQVKLSFANDEEPVCNFTFSSYSTSDCQDLFLETTGTIVADGNCNQYPSTVDQTSGPGPYYRALCLKRGFAMTAARCSNDKCNSCKDEGRYRQNYDGSGWGVDDRKGTCHTIGVQGQSFFAELIPSEEDGFISEGDSTKSPTVSPSVSPTDTPTISSISCKWQLKYHGADNIFNDFSCSKPSSNIDIIADGFCHYDEELLYYKARSTSCGLVFDAAHCTKPDCRACFEYSSGNVVFNDCLEDAQVCGFLGNKEPYLSTGCYARLKKESGLGGREQYSDIWSFYTDCGTFPRADCKGASSSSKTKFDKTLVFVSVAAFAHIIIQ